MQFTRIEANHLRLRAAVAAMAASGLDGEAYRRLQPLVRRELRKLERAPVAWAVPLIELLQAGIAALEGHHENAARLLTSAAEGCDRSQLALYAAAARMRLAQLLERPDDERGRAGASYLRAQGALKPERWCDVLVPGFTAPRGRNADPSGRSGTPRAASTR